MPDIPGTTNYPSTLDTASTLLETRNSPASAVLVVSVDADDTTFTLDNAANFPNSGAFIVESEIVYYSGKTGNNLTGAIRARDSTVAASHLTGVTVQMVYTSRHHQVQSEAIIAAETKLGSGNSSPVAGRLLSGIGAGISSWANTITGAFTFAADLAASVPLRVKAFAGQTGHLLDVLDSASAVIAWINAAGEFVFRGPMVDIRSFGADDTGVADCTNALRAAAAYAQSGVFKKRIYIPAGNYFFRGDGTEILLVTKSLIIEGDGPGSTFLRIASDVPNTRDFIRYYPFDSNDAFGLQIRNLIIRPHTLATNPARNGVRVDITQVGSVPFAARMLLQNVHIGHDGDSHLGGAAFYFHNPSGADPSFFTSTFDNCQFIGGVNVQNAGDSLHWINCVFTGYGTFILDLISGAAVPIVSGCNFTCDGGVWIKRAAKLIFNDFWMEAHTTFDTTQGANNGAYFTLDGDAAAFAFAAHIYDGQMSLLTSTPATTGILLNRANRPKLDNIAFYIPDAGKIGIATNVNTIRPRIDLDTIALSAGNGTLLSRATQSLADVPILANTADSAAIGNTTAETTFSKSAQIAANTLEAGDVIEVILSGFTSCDPASATSLPIRIKIGGQLIGSFQASPAAGLSLQPWSATVYCVVRSKGAGGSIVGAGGRAKQIGTLATETDLTPDVTQKALNTTINQSITVTAQWGLARAGDSIVLRSIIARITHGETIV